MLRATVQRLAAAAVLTLAATAPGAWAQSAFVYQGSLLYDGEPYTGTADYLFTLWTSESGGVPASEPLARSGVEIREGLFQSELDFGSESLLGNRWLSIAVRTPAWDGQGPEPAFTPLPGRQRVSGSPYSIRTRGIYVNQAGNRVGIGTTEPESTLHVRGQVRADGGVRFNSGALPDVIRDSAVFDFGQVSGTFSTDMVIFGLEEGDFFLHSFESLPPQIQLTSVEIVDTWRLRFTFHNALGFPFNPAPFNVNVIVFK